VKINGKPMKNIFTLLLLILLTEAFGEGSVIKQKILIIKNDVEVEEIYEGFSDYASEYENIEDVNKKTFCYISNLENVCKETTHFAEITRQEYDAGETMDLLDGLKCKRNENKVNISYMLSNDESHEPFFVEKVIQKCK
jgi:hypothetical protein